LIKIPFLTPTPIPTSTAVGVAKPKAQGHAITNTEMPVTKEKANRSKKVGS